MYDKRILNQKLAPEGGWRTIRKPGLKENIAPERKNLYFHPGRGGGCDCADSFENKLQQCQCQNAQFLSPSGIDLNKKGFVPR